MSVKCHDNNVRIYKDAGGPLCLRFWTHMFGHGVGSLNVYVRAGAKDRKIWGLTGDAGNNWYMGQAPIASTDNFRVSINIDISDYTYIYAAFVVHSTNLQT